MAPEIDLRAFDWIAICAYVVMTFAIAFWARRSQASADDFYLAGRSMHWFFIGISMYATLFSTISFVSMPGEGYKHGMLLSLQSVGYTLFTPLAMWLFLRFFYNTKSFTAYEYLERRYNRATRTLGSVVFLVSRALYGALVFYSASKAFETLVGWDPLVTILVIGGLTIAYSYLGGMRAIIVTDVIQAGVIITGLLLIVYRLSDLVGFDFAAVWRTAREADHAYGMVSRPEFFSFDPHLRYTFWLLLIQSVMNPLTNYGTDQLVVQRILASNSYSAAKKAILLKTLGALPLSLTFYFSGILLFHYFGVVARPPEGVGPDGMLGFFINQHLPSPVPGIIAAALIAALMSTFDSTINSLSTVFSVDILQRHGWVSPSANLLRLGKRLTLLFGASMIGLAIFVTYTSESVESSVLEISSIWTCLWGVLLVVVLGGIFTRWVTPRGAFWALAAGMAVNLALPWKLYYGTPADERISFVWVGVPGWLVTLGVMAGISLFDSRKKANIEGLTWDTVVHPESKP